MSEDKLLSAPNVSESLKESENNFDDTKPKMNFSKSRIEKTRKTSNGLRHKFSKSNINLYERKTKRIFLHQK